MDYLKGAAAMLVIGVLYLLFQNIFTRLAMIEQLFGGIFVR